jgi:hypothetical protein
MMPAMAKKLTAGTLVFKGIRQSRQNQRRKQVSGENEVQTRANNLPTATAADSEAVTPHARSARRGFWSLLVAEGCGGLTCIRKKPNGFKSSSPRLERSDYLGLSVLIACATG